MPFACEPWGAPCVCVMGFWTEQRSCRTIQHWLLSSTFMDATYLTAAGVTKSSAVG